MTGAPMGLLLQPPPLPPDFPFSGAQIEEMVVIVSVALFTMIFLIAVGVPLVRAWVRRMDLKGVAPPQIPAEFGARLERIEQAVDAVSIEVERISEGQRFTTKLLAELRGLPRPSERVEERKL